MPEDDDATPIGIPTPRVRAQPGHCTRHSAAWPAHFQSMQIPVAPDHIAPDGSAIRSLLRVRGGSLANCARSAEASSKAVVHQTIEEIWYCLAGMRTYEHVVPALAVRSASG
jgi:hypothetical protein